MRLLLLLGLLLPPTAGTSPQVNERHIIGRSIQGREIIADRYGTPGGKVVAVVGQIHGNEKNGPRIADRIVRRGVPAGYELWVIRTVNPDGNKHGTRQNARGVDLNRNFPTRWRNQSCPGKYCSGPAPASEPETEALMAFLQDRRPELMIFYHSSGQVVDASRRSVGNFTAVEAYARRTRLPVRTVSCGPGGCTGNATQYAFALNRAATAFVVELPCDTGCLDPARIDRHVQGFWDAARRA